MQELSVDGFLFVEFADKMSKLSQITILRVYFGAKIR